MSIKKPANLGPRPQNATPARVADTFITASGSQTKLTHRIDTDLHKRFKRVALEEDRPMGEILNQLIYEYTTKHERGDRG